MKSTEEIPLVLKRRLCTVDLLMTNNVIRLCETKAAVIVDLGSF